MHDELDAVKKLQIKNHAEWPAVFSTNSDCQIWCYCRSGKTPYSERVFVQGVLKIIDLIAEMYRNERPSGGRFFISDAGAFYKEEDRDGLQFIEFQFMD